MDFPCSTVSWRGLAHLRKRGQRPAGPIFVTDHEWQRHNLVDSGGFALGFPAAVDAYLVAGLEVVVIADGGGPAVEVAQMLAASSPKYLATYWRGRGLQVVIGEGA